MAYDSYPAPSSNILTYTMALEHTFKMRLFNHQTGAMTTNKPLNIVNPDQSTSSFGNSINIENTGLQPESYDHNFLVRGEYKLQSATNTVNYNSGIILTIIVTLIIYLNT